MPRATKTFFIRSYYIRLAKNEDNWYYKAVMEDNQFQPPLGNTNSSRKDSGKFKKFLFMFIFLLLLVGVGFATTKYFLKSDKETKSLTIVPTITEYQFPADTPTPQAASPTASLKKTIPTTKPTEKPVVNSVDPVSGLDRGELNIEVQNGSGEAGVAGKGSDTLKNLGYKISATGNADNFDYQDVTIQVKSTKSKYLTLLKKDLGFSYTVGTTSADLSSDSSADALVIIGK